MAGYDQTRLIQLALQKIGAINRGATPSAQQTTDAIDALDDMIQEWNADGLRTFVMNDITIPLVADQQVYNIGPTGTDLVTPRPERVIAAWRRNIASKIDTPIIVLAKKDYDFLSNKSQTGTPIQIYYDKHAPNANVYSYLVPDASAASTYALYMTVQQPLDSVTASTTSMQFPNAWFQALKWGLARELAPDYGVPKLDRDFITQQAQAFKANLENFDQEDASVYFTIDKTGQFRL